MTTTTISTAADTTTSTMNTTTTVTKLYLPSLALFNICITAQRVKFAGFSIAWFASSPSPSSLALSASVRLLPLLKGAY